MSALREVMQIRRARALYRAQVIEALIAENERRLKEIEEYRECPTCKALTLRTEMRVDS